MTNIIEKAAEKKLAQNHDKPLTISAYIKKMEPTIAKLLPSVVTPERFIQDTLSALSTTPKLQECTPRSFLSAMLKAAQMGLEPNTPLGQAYLIPYKNHGRLECQFQIGYRGLINLFHNDNGSTIQAHTVYENDLFEYEFGLEPKLKHVPAKSDRGVPIYFYASYHTTNGGYGFEVMSIDDVRAHAQKYSKSYSNGPWQTNFEEMALKTVLKKALKYAPMKIETARALASDESINYQLDPDMLSMPDETYIETEGTAVDPETGEVVEGG